jgi:hypothetical protein
VPARQFCVDPNFYWFDSITFVEVKKANKVFPEPVVIGVQSQVHGRQHRGLPAVVRSNYDVDTMMRIEGESREPSEVANVNCKNMHGIASPTTLTNPRSILFLSGR